MQTDLSDRPSGPRVTKSLKNVKRWSPLVILLAGATLTHTYSLLRFPPPNVDEAWFASRAWAFIRTGVPFGSLDAGVIDQLEGYEAFWPWIPTFIQSLGLRFSSSPSLLALRAESLFFGLVLLASVYTIGRRLGGQALGLLSGVLVSLSWPFLYSAHIARHDVMAASLGFAATALYFNNRGSRLWLSFLGGLCSSVAFEIHPHSAIYIPALVALRFLHVRRAMFRSPGFWSFIAGVTTGFILYIALHVLPNPRAFYALQQLVFADTHTPPIFTLNWHIIMSAFGELGRLLLHTYTLVPLAIWAVVVLGRRRSEADQSILVLNGTLLAGASVLIRNKIGFYAILFTPALDLMIAASLLWLLRRTRSSRFWHLAVRAMVCFPVVVIGAQHISLLQTDYMEAYQTVQSRIVQAVQPADAVLGSQTYWFGLYDHVYYSWEQLVYYQRYVQGSTLEDALQALRPDILIIDGHMSGFISDRPGKSPYSKFLRLSRTEMECFLDDHAQIIMAIDNDIWGNIRVFRIAW